MDNRPKVHKATPHTKSNSASADSVSWSTTVLSPPYLPSGNIRPYQKSVYSRHLGGARPKFEENPPYTGVLYSDREPDRGETFIHGQRNPPCAVVLHSDREPDRVSARDSSACSSLAEPDNGVTLSYQIRHTRNLAFMTKSSLLRTIEKECKVRTFVDKDQCWFDIKGPHDDANLTLKRIEDIDKSISVNSIEICNERAVNYFKKESGDEYLASVDRSCDVLLEKEIIYSTDGTTVKKVVSDKNVVWTCLDRKLTLEKNTFVDVKASLKVTPVVKNKDGKVFSKNGNIVEMEIGWEAPNLERFVTELLKKASEDDEREVALPLNPVGNCTFDGVMKGFVNCFLQWLFLQQSKPNPASVVLFTETVDYYDRADTYIEDRILDILKGKKRHGQTKIHLVKDQLDQTQADVLVNTAEPQLDLTYGKVSAALLKAAGPGLQQECRHKYPAGITQDSVAVTKGHGLKCKEVFHVTLPLYKEGMESIKSVRDTMMRCLQKASDSRHTSIAFPAVGTGKLRYPLDIVSSEMYGAVKRFIKGCPDTSLRNIIFVIFPKDVDVLKDFEMQQKRYTNDAQTNDMQSSVSIHIIGMPEKVSLAKEMIQSKQKELMININDRVTEVIPSVSSTDFSALVKFHRKEFDSFAETGVKISYNKNKNEIEVCGTRANIDVAFVSVKSSLSKVLDMPKCKLCINCPNDKLIYNLNTNEDVCIVHDDHAPSLFVFAKSENILDQIKSILQQQNESSTTTLATMMENSDLSEREEEEMDTSDNGLICSQTESAVKKTALTREFSWSKDAEHVDIYETGTVVIKVYKANILYIPVDAIVNAPSQGGGGSALAAGEAVLRFYEAPACHKRGLPPICSISCTKDVHRGGKCEIDAGWPCWSADTRRSEEGLKQYSNALKQTVYNCFLTADNYQMASIGLQTKGSVPTDVCATQYARAVLGFSDRSTTLREIHIVDDDRSNVDIVHKTFSAMIREGKQSPFPLSIYLQRSSSEDSHKAVKTNINNENKTIKWTGRSKPKMSSVSSNPSPGMTVAAYRSDKNRLVCTFQRSHEVYIYDGDITQLQNIDAIVCSESDKGEAKGKISKTLLERGGQRYAESKAAQFQNKRRIGEVITTEGGRNNYKWVIHAIASRKNESLLPEIYKNIFQEANVRELHSVALPLLEAGDLKPEGSTKILFTEMKRFFNERKGKGLTLHVVLNDPAISYVVKEVFKGCIDEMTGGPSQEEKTMLQENDDNEQQSNQAAVADDCVICMDKVTNAEVLKCGHVFCKDCIDGYFRVKKVCPTCGKVCGEVTGDQPDGTMDIAKRHLNLTGFEHCKTITISYRFGDGIQGPDHPKPGTPFKGISRTAYLPDNQEGREVCALLKVAFQRQLVFTIGTSRTTGKEGVITWNDIHHKTDHRPHTQFGYPDKTYLQRVRDELAAKGVTEQDIEKQFLKELEKSSFRQSFRTGNYVTYL